MKFNRAIETIYPPENLSPLKNMEIPLIIRERKERPWNQIPEYQYELQSRKELAGGSLHRLAVNKLLEKKRNALIGRKVHLAEEWILLALREKSFQNLVEEENEKVIYHQERAAFALEKTRQSKLFIKEYQLKIDEMKQNISELRDVKRKMDEQLERHALYGKFLCSIPENYPEYPNCMSILNRYETIQETRKFIAKRGKKALMTWAILQEMMGKSIMKKESEIQELKTQLAMMLLKSDGIKHDIVEKEEYLELISDSIQEKEMSLASVVSGIFDIYVNICARAGIPPSGNLEDKVIAIRSRFDAVHKMVSMTEFKNLNHHLPTKIRFK